MEPGQLRDLQDRVAQVAVGAAVREYLVALAHATPVPPAGHARAEPARAVDLAAAGAGPRLPAGRGYVTPDDVQDVAEPVLGVRLGIEPDATARVQAEIMASVPVPVYAEGRLRVSWPVRGTCIDLNQRRNVSHEDTEHRYFHARAPGGSRGRLPDRTCGLPRGASPGDAEGHDEGHAGHVIPAHKPKTFPGAVRRFGS